MAHDKGGSKDMKPQGKSQRTGRGLASPGGAGTPPGQAQQAAGRSGGLDSGKESERVLGRSIKKPR